MRTLSWVWLPCLPMEFRGEEIFVGIDACSGELLSVDPMTSAKRLSVYARICVTAKQSSNFPKEIDLFFKLSRWVQKVEYESISFVFFHCKRVGHWAREHPSNPKPKRT